MLIGIVGAPNKGKSTLFSAITENEVAIADYPFTTINPNMGVGYVGKPCVEKQLGVKCKPRNSLCANGVRMLPINIIDVAGLVEGAHQGKGMGNQFLNDLASADALIMVADASGKSDANGNPCTQCDAVKDIEIVMDELVEWLTAILLKHIPKISTNPNGVEALYSTLSGLKISREDIENTIDQLALTSSRIKWSQEDCRAFAAELLFRSKKFVIAANKADASSSAAGIAALENKYGKENVIGCSAIIEMALRKAAKNKLITYNYMENPDRFDVAASELQTDVRNGLEYSKAFLQKNHGTNVQKLLQTLVFQKMEQIVVYPVEDENKYTDHFGNVLPDAILVSSGSTAYELACAIHTDLGKGMLYAINAKTKLRVKKDYMLQDGDVIKIVSASH